MDSSVRRFVRGLLFAAALTPLVAWSSSARADAPPEAPAPPTPKRTLVDRVAVRYVTPETGGTTRPRFITERELAFAARLEALAERSSEPYAERFVRTAEEGWIAEDMLSELFVRRGSEPAELPRLVDEAWMELEERVGAAPLKEALGSEGISEDELRSFLRRRVRAAFYVDRVIVPVLSPREDELREAFRTALHPFRGARYEDKRVEFARWLAREKQRLAEIEFLQAARSRVRITAIVSAPDAQGR